MKIENKEYSEKCRTCRWMDALRRFMGLRQRSEGAEKETHIVLGKLRGERFA
jgi:hypothetical protein